MVRAKARASIEEGCGAYKNGNTARWTRSVRRRAGESDSTHERSLARTRVFARTRESRRGRGRKGRRREGRCGGARTYKAATGDTKRSLKKNHAKCLMTHCMTPNSTASART